MEGKSFLDYIQEKGPMTEDAARVVMRRLFETLKVIHANDIAHRDIKFENLMFRNPDYDLNSICLIDFGFARTPDADNIMKSGVGTTEYMSPQTVNGESYTVKSDIWSMGVVLYGM